MMRRTAIVITLGSLLMLSAPLRAGSEGDGGQPGAFRDLKLGGRPSAMGGAFTAVAEGGTGHLYNPAGLGQSRMYEFSFSYRAMHLDRRLGYASAAMPAKEDARLSLNWIYAGTSDLEARDEMGNVIPGEDISYGENLIGITFAKRFIPQLMLGGKVFYIQNSIANITAYTVGVDLGVLAAFDMRKTLLRNYFPVLRAGLTAENLGATYRWTTEDYWVSRGRERGSSVDESFPINFRLGASLTQPNAYLAAADIEVNTASMVKTHFGGEYTIARTLALRAGLDDLNPTFGIGILKRLNQVGVSLDISYLFDKVNEGDDVLVSFDIVF